MAESVKINRLEIENVKRVRAVVVEPTASGLTVIGGNNGQGKTSVLDAIAWALGGNQFKPSAARREGSAVPPRLHIVMNSGLVVERKGKNSDLKVTDPEGKKGGQQLLNEFVEELALNLPKFMNAGSREKARTLLDIIGVGGQLAELDKKEAELCSQRLAVGRIADQKEKAVKELPCYPDMPGELVSVSELVRQQQEILARNGENQRLRENLHRLEQEQQSITQKLQELLRHQAEVDEKVRVARLSAEDLHDESTAELERNIACVEETNRKIRANLDREKAEDDAAQCRDQYDRYTDGIERIRKARMELLDGADLPLPGLSVEEGELVYNGVKWDCMSGSDQLKVATAIVRKLNPRCGFVLLDKLEQMDAGTLAEFGRWLEEEGLQAIATRVSVGDECSVIIEDGYVKGQKAPEGEPKKAGWTPGQF